MKKIICQKEFFFSVFYRLKIAWGPTKILHNFRKQSTVPIFYPRFRNSTTPTDKMTQPAWARGTCESYKGKRSMALVPFSRNHVEVLWIILKHNGRSCLNRVSNFLFFSDCIISKHYGCRSRGVRGVQRLEKQCVKFKK